MTEIKSIITAIEGKKKADGIDPHDATFREIMEVVTQEVKDSINAMVASGEIEFHRTINDVSFNIKQ